MSEMPDLINLEHQGWKALSSAPDEALKFYSNILAEDAEMIFPGGIRLIGREQILATMGGPPWQSFEISEERLAVLSDTAGAVTYKVIARREGAEPYQALICSTYALHAGEWRLVIHQQTPV